MRRSPVVRTLLAPLAAFVLIALVAIACGPAPDAPASSPAVAEPLGAQECAVCGMIVREQPIPRAQVVHRDGARDYLCSPGDLLVFLTAPSPHGRSPVAFVEVLDPSEDPTALDRDPHPWVRADRASYVVGLHRPRSMGPAILAYADQAGAMQVAGRHPGSRVLDFAALRSWWAERQKKGRIQTP